ncbi:hypothetical protein M8C21_006949 [Ambrosia artemisiifolia]|uniref:Uncharacterized protein n=1 Tax=Ambrosia artemisiifolia TaxID=4212 RepID=A0AAD5BKB7_AMBAR|nr:hypothetical protein M8C21_006949 [Ambrosia artemisiifolia]
MEESVVTDNEVKRSDAANNDDDDVVLSSSQTDDLLIDVSSSSTLTVPPSSGPENATSVEQTETVETEANKSTCEEIGEMPKLIETVEPEKSRKNGKFNLRKSLAWDSAFFTSDGVLDADELTTMIEGGEKRLKNCLPGIEEEVYRSMESISTLESDNLSLDCLEAELFEDIRASIQNCNKLSNLTNSSIKLSSAKRDSQPKVINTPKKVDLGSVKRLAARTKDNKTSSIPQPKITNRVNLNMKSMSTSTKSALLSANHAKDQDTAKQAHATDVKVRSSVNISRKKDVSKSGKPTTTSIVPQTPSRINMKSKQPPVNSNLSYSISPASSISEWSSVSSSSASTSTINPKCTSRGSIDTSGQSDLRIHPTDRISNKKGSQPVVVHPSQTGSGSRPPAVQPTGLRMPSPKIGFFDGGKAGARTPNGSVRSQSKLPTSVPKTVSTHFSQTSSNGVKFGKLPPPKTLAVATNLKPNPQKLAPKSSQQQQTSNPETKTCPGSVTSDVSDHKTEASLNICINPSQNMNNDSNKRPDLGNNGYEVPSSECLVVKENKMDRPITDGSRTPFAVKNSVCDANATSMEVTEKTVNFHFIDSQQNENSEVV